MRRYIVAVPIRALVGLLALATAAHAQDSRGEVATDAPAYNGQRASAPIPTQYHIINEGGSDGAGLCVISSVLANGLYQGVPGLDVPGLDQRSGRTAAGKGSQLWRTAKALPGGYGPSKLAGLVEATVPGEPYASYLGRDTGVLDRLSRVGYPVGVTMNTGSLYSYRLIHHMVSLAHYRSGGWAMVRDNNDRPGIFRAMPASEFDRRWIDGGYGWAWAWTRLPAAEAGGTLLIAIAAVAVIAIQRRRLDAQQ
jgi:hypothetical protein